MIEGFITPVNQFPEKISLKYDDKLMLFGSCFSENIGDKLNQIKFDVLVNPFGILYNPLCISNNIRSLISNDLPKKESLFKHNDLWHSWNYHGCFSHSDIDLVYTKIISSFKLAATAIKKVDLLIITFGTSFTYRLLKSNNVVANCHKIPSDQFLRERLSPKHIISEYSEIIESLKKLNPDIKILFSVSPIRHIKDGAHQNQLSKSSLLLSIDALCEQNKDCYYFPSYEIMMDELRDYRFYKDDLLHPSKQAINYIWDRFKENCISKRSYDTIYQIEKLNLSINHKPLNPESKKHKEFKAKQYMFCKLLSEKYDNIDFSNELDYFRD